MRIGIIGPTEKEINPFIHKIENKVQVDKARLKFFTGTFEGVEVVAVFSGVCKVNAAIAAQLLISEFKVSHMIVTGVAGALGSQLKVGDTVISSEVAYHDVHPGILTEYHPWMADIYFKADGELVRLCQETAASLNLTNKCYTGRIITGEAFITHNERERLIENFNPLCVDMESTSVAHVCYANNVPFVAIRSMSDNADEAGTESFVSNMENAALNSMRFAEALIKCLGSIETEAALRHEEQKEISKMFMGDELELNKWTKMKELGKSKYYGTEILKNIMKFAFTLFITMFVTYVVDALWFDGSWESIDMGRALTLGLSVAAAGFVADIITFISRWNRYKEKYEE